MAGRCRPKAEEAAKVAKMNAEQKQQYEMDKLKKENERLQAESVKISSPEMRQEFSRIKVLKQRRRFLILLWELMKQIPMQGLTLS